MVNLKPYGLWASLLLAAGAFISTLALNRHHPFRLSPTDYYDALFFTALAVSAFQIRGRTQRPFSSVLYGCLGSAILFRYVCWNGFFGQSGAYDLRLALIFWFAATIIGLIGIVALERADRIGRNR